jgi:hypothetical protein
MTSYIPIFTRYLYDVSLVERSLELSLLAKNREEALYWAYELYHSGFQEYVWQLLFTLYNKHYSAIYPQLKMRLSKIHAEWCETHNVCLLGNVVGTLVVWDPNEKDSSKPRFNILYKEDRHATKPVITPVRHYLKHVSNYSVRPCNIDPTILQNIREAYLGKDWLYYCSKTPVWAERIHSAYGIVNDEKKCVEFENDDALESFYDKWGIEPDEQPDHIHVMHGII